MKKIYSIKEIAEILGHDPKEIENEVLKNDKKYLRDGVDLYFTPEYIEKNWQIKIRFCSKCGQRIIISSINMEFYCNCTCEDCVI